MSLPEVWELSLLFIRWYVCMCFVLQASIIIDGFPLSSCSPQVCHLTGCKIYSLLGQSNGMGFQQILQTDAPKTMPSPSTLGMSESSKCLCFSLMAPTQLNRWISPQLCCLNSILSFKPCKLCTMVSGMCFNLVPLKNTTNSWQKRCHIPLHCTQQCPVSVSNLFT
jgi:hypothetical protein